MAPIIRVVLADDHPIVRNGIKGFIELADDIQVVGEASSGQETLTLVTETAPDILLLDMQLPDMKGVEVAQQLQQRGCKVKILALSAHDDSNYIQGMLAAGASGYLIKEEAPQMIVEAIRGVAQGEQGWVSRSVAANIAAILRGDEEQPTKLTPREMDVLRLVVDGKTNQNIALELGISEKTVEKYLGEIFKILDVSSRTEAAVLAVREGLFKQ